MTIIERNNKLKHFITCLKCEASGKCCNDNCSTQYDAGTIGDIIENLEAISKVLEQDPILDKINKMKSEIADSLEFWDYSPNNNPLARDMLETLTKFFGDIKTETL